MGLVAELQIYSAPPVASRLMIFIVDHEAVGFQGYYRGDKSGWEYGKLKYHKTHCSFCVFFFPLSLVRFSSLDYCEPLINFQILKKLIFFSCSNWLYEKAGLGRFLFHHSEDVSFHRHKLKAFFKKLFHNELHAGFKILLMRQLENTKIELNTHGNLVFNENVISNLWRVMNFEIINTGTIEYLTIRK